MSAEPETSITATGAGGLTIRYGSRVARCDLSMPPAQYAEAHAACGRLLREMVEDLIRAEVRELKETPHG